MVCCYIVLELGAPIILRMDWLTQINPKINWSEKMIKWNSNDMNVLLEACSSSGMRKHVGQLNLIGAKQLNNLVCTTKGRNICAWVIQWSMRNKLNAAELEKVKCPNGTHLCTDTSI